MGTAEQAGSPSGGAREGQVVYAAGVAQGIVLVTFPAASTIFTNPADYGLSSTQYGTLFLPQVVAAIASALLTGRLARRFSTKPIYLAGLLAGLISMALLLASSLLSAENSFAYALLLVATAFLGAGFGLTVPALNRFAAAFHPRGVDRAVLVLNALLGLGTVLAPLFVALFVGVGFWQGLPIISAILLSLLWLVSVRLPLRTESATVATPGTQAGRGIPTRYWIYAGFAVLYGICETLNGNWAELDMSSELGASASLASLTLTTFWAMVTVGRVLFALIQRVVPSRAVYHALPFLLAAAFVLISALNRGDTAAGVIAFGLAGLGCSALLPLTISFAQEELVSMSAGVAGGIIGFYQVGYGLAAFGVGPLLANGAKLHSIYAAAAVLALAMGVWSFAVAGRRPSPAALHPRLQPGG
jgi:MFS family permease